MVRFKMDAENGKVSNIPKYLDGLSMNGDGHLALIASNLTSRHWDGLIAVFSDPKFAPEIPHIDSATETEAGNSDIAWVDSKRMIVASDSGSVEVWKILEDGQAMENSLSLTEHDDICCSVCVNESHQQILSGSWDGRIKVWDLAVEMSVQTFNVHIDKVLSVSWNQNNPDLLASASEDGNVYIFDTRDLKPAQVLVSDMQSFPCAVNWQQSKEEKLAVGFSDGRVTYFDARNPTQSITTYQPHTKNINRIEFSASRQNLIASVSDDMTLSVRDIEANTFTFKSKIHEDYVKGLCWDEKNNSYWTCAWDGRVVQTKITKENMEVDS